MSLRNQLKVPRYGLFYFEADKTVSIVPLKKVVKVLEGDNSSEGSKVEVAYGDQILKAEIVAVHDDKHELKEKELEFICDPKKSHLFPEPLEEDSQDELEPAAKNENKRKRKVAQKNIPPKLKKPLKKENGKVKATVIARFKPGPSSGERESSSPISVEIHGSPKSHPSPIPSSSSISTPKQFTPCNTLEPPSPFPRVPITPVMNRYMACNLAPTYSEIPGSETSEMLSVRILTRLEKKLDHLTTVMTQFIDQQQPVAKTDMQPQLPIETVSPQVLHASLEASPCDSDFSLDLDLILQMQKQSSSVGNFAVRLVHQLFKTSELVGRNARGVKGKKQLDPAQLNKVTALVHQNFPCAPSDLFMVDRDC